MNKKILILIIGLVLLSGCMFPMQEFYQKTENLYWGGNVSIKLDSRILDKFNELEEVKVIIEIKDTSGIIILVNDTRQEQIIKDKKKKEFLESKINLVLSTISEEEFKLEGKLLSGRGVYGKITKEGFEKLIKNPNIEAIYLQEDLHVAQ